MKKFLAAFLILLTLSGCGVKSPPRPPAEALPPIPEGMRARVREGCVELAWKAPPAEVVANAAADVATAAGATVVAAAQTAAQAAAVAGLPVPLPVDHYEILRASEPAADEQPVFEPAGESASPSFVDCAGAGRFLYKTRAVSADGRRSEATRAVGAIAAAAPAPPERLAANGGDRFVELSWRRPAGMPADVRFNVYRSTEAGKFPWRPINPAPLADTHYSDGPLDNGARYFYEVRAASPQLKGPWTEGAAARAEATPVDLVAPSAPQGLIASWTGKVVELRWFKNSEPDVAGYNVYRRTGGGRFVRLTDKPLTDNTFTDRSARPGRSYEYAVTAVDNAPKPNESAASQVTSLYSTP